MVIFGNYLALLDFSHHILKTNISHCTCLHLVYSQFLNPKKVIISLYNTIILNPLRSNLKTIKKISLQIQIELTSIC